LRVPVVKRDFLIRDTFVSLSYRGFGTLTTVFLCFLAILYSLLLRDGELGVVPSCKGALLIPKQSATALPP